MGVDCVFAAENRNNATVKDIETDSLGESFPGGKGRFVKDGFTELDLEHPVFAYCYLEFVGDLVFVHDGCRYHLNRDYQLEVIEYLKRKCGGMAGVWPDTSEISFNYENADMLGDEWLQPITPYTI